VVNFGHKLADFTLHEPCMATRELLLVDQAYRDLGIVGTTRRALFRFNRCDQRGNWIGHLISLSLETLKP